MSYTVWIMVENDDDLVGEMPNYWSVASYEEHADALAHAEVMAKAEEERTGQAPERLDD